MGEIYWQTAVVYVVNCVVMRKAVQPKIKTPTKSDK